MTDTDLKIAVVIPCYRVTQHIETVLQAIPETVWKVYCIDDACPDRSGDFIRELTKDWHNPPIRIRHDQNQGVGGAVISGYRAALKDGADIIVKIDGDGQMDPALLSRFTEPIAQGLCDYTKGNRFYKIENIRDMPRVRVFGNAVLSFLTKLSSGYWKVFDPTNGYTAIHASALAQIPLEKLSKRYFFESDLLFRLNIARASIIDVPMRAVYGDEESHLHIKDIVAPFLAGHMRNFGKRIFYSYFLRDFSLASIQLVIGLVLLLFGSFFGGLHWIDSAASGIPATAGTVMLSGLPIILGVQLLLSFLHYDIEQTPKSPLHKSL